MIDKNRNPLDDVWVFGQKKATESLDKPLEWATGFFFGNVELSLELWAVIAGISGFDDEPLFR